MATRLATPHSISEGENELRVSAYDRVASMLISSLLLVGIAVVGLFFLWLSTRVFVRQPAVPVLLEDVTGGSPDGVEGESLQLEGPDTNEFGNDPELVEPQMERTLNLVQDVLATQRSEIAATNVVSDAEYSGGFGGSIGDGRRPGLGEGGGGRGVPRGLRWEIDFPAGMTLTQYASFLDQFGIELGVLGAGPDVIYLSKFTSGAPQRRSGPREAEKRLYLSWTRGRMREADEQLLGRAGIATSGRIVVQFLPADTENLLAVRERDFAQRAAVSIRRTRFQVEFRDARFDFRVLSQTTL